MIISFETQSNKRDNFLLDWTTGDWQKSSTHWLKKVAEVGLLQAIQNTGEAYLLALVYNHFYRPIEPTTGLRVKNPFDGLKGNGTGGTTKAKINLISDPKSTLWSVSFNYYKSLRSYRCPESKTEQILEPLIFLKWYFFVAISMIIAYPTIRFMERKFPKQGEKSKNWYASTPMYNTSECDVIVSD